MASRAVLGLALRHAPGSFAPSQRTAVPPATPCSVHVQPAAVVHSKGGREALAYVTQGLLYLAVAGDRQAGVVLGAEPGPDGLQ